MVDRINLLLQAKNITSRQFAEEIGIQPSGMSHILSGRNNPSLDFVMKVIRRWPEININWLMFGKGEMFTSVVVNPTVVAPVPPQAAPAPAPAPEPDLFSSFEPAPSPAPASVQSPAPAQTPVQSPTPAPIQVSSPAPVQVPVPAPEPAPATEIPMKTEPPAAPGPAPTLVADPVPAPTPAPASAAAPESVKAEPVLAPSAAAEPPVESAKPIIDENRVKTFVSASAPLQPILPKQKKIVKMVVLYDDHTFSEYYPE